MVVLSNKLVSLITNLFSAPWVCGYVLLYFLFKHIYLINLQVILGICLFLYVIPWIPVLIYSIIKKRTPSRLSGSERIPFVVIGLISYVLGTIYFYLMKPRTIISEFLIAMHLMYIFFSLLIIIGNLWSKPSIHVGGFTAPVTLIALFDNIILLIFLILAPLVGWTRIKLRIHTLNQLMLGFTIGVSSAILSYLTILLLM